MKIAPTALLALACVLVSCAGGSKAPFEPPAVSSPGSLDANLSLYPLNGGVRQSSERCYQGGGTWKVPSISKRLQGSIQYGQNQCSKKARLIVESSVNGAGSSCINQAGYTYAGLGVGMTPEAQETFAGSNLVATIASNTLDQMKMYTVFLFDDSFKIYFQQFVGTPNRGALTFSSPFQGGFQWPEYSALLLIVCYSS